MKRLVSAAILIVLTSCSGGSFPLFPTQTPTPAPTPTHTPIPDFRQLTADDIKAMYADQLEFSRGGLGWVGTSANDCLGLVIYTEEGDLDGLVEEMAVIVRDEAMDAEAVICPAEARAQYVEAVLGDWVSPETVAWSLDLLDDATEIGTMERAYGSRYVRERNYHIYALRVDAPGADSEG